MLLAACSSGEQQPPRTADPALRALCSLTVLPYSTPEQALVLRQRAISMLRAQPTQQVVSRRHAEAIDAMMQLKLAGPPPPPTSLPSPEVDTWLASNDAVEQTAQARRKLVAACQ
jgi:hypothetical protein